MSEPRKKPSADELVREILADDPDAQELLAMSPAEVERELEAGGFDLERARKQTARQLERLRAAAGAGAPEARAPAQVVPLARRRALRWSLLAAALVALALAAMPAIEMLATDTGDAPRRGKARHDLELEDKPPAPLPALAPGEAPDAGGSKPHAK
jgi:hypothetical protein